MKESSDRRKRGADADGVRAFPNRRGELLRWAGLVAAGITAAAAGFVLVRAFDRSPRIERSPAPAVSLGPTKPTSDRAVASTRTVTVRTVRAPSTRTGAGGDSAESAASEGGSQRGDDARPEIDARDYIAALRDSGETEGIAAFNPPGTRPPQSGIVVPDDYELPEGFMRHYQSTDDGRQLDPILTLAPGYELVDEDGNAVDIARDRIVPPQFAPPDLPVHMLEVPSATDRADGER